MIGSLRFNLRKLIPETDDMSDQTSKLAYHIGYMIGLKSPDIQSSVELVNISLARGLRDGSGANRATHIENGGPIRK